VAQSANALGFGAKAATHRQFHQHFMRTFLPIFWRQKLQS